MFTIKRSQNFNPFGYRIGRGFNPAGIEIGKLTSSPETLAFWRSVKPANLPEKKPAVVLQRTYRKTLEFAFVAVLTIINLVVQLGRDFALKVGRPSQFLS